MALVGLWQVTDHGPKRLETATVDLEKHLEGWIEQHPDLLQKGLVIVGRQVPVGARRLDLLALDPEGRWAVIEVKRGTCGGEALGQAIEYAASIATMPFEDLRTLAEGYLASKGRSLAALPQAPNVEESPSETMREVSIFLVGTGKAPDEDRMVQYLAQYDMPIYLVSYQLAQLDDGTKILLRELAEAEIDISQPSRWKVASIDEICAHADQQSIGVLFRKIREAAEALYLYPRAWKHCIMYAPASNRTRALFTVMAYANPEGKLNVYLNSKCFPEFYPVTHESVESLVGSEGWHTWGPEQVATFVGNLKRLFDTVQRGTET